MPEGADVGRDSGPAAQERFGVARLPRHRRAMEARIPGRTEALGGPRLPGDPGGQEPDVDPSCRHRRGPTGPPHAPEGGLAARRQARRPVPAVPVVLTLPPARHARGRRPPPDLDDRLRRAAAPALITRALDPPDVGGLMGVWCLLHPWTRPLTD